MENILNETVGQEQTTVEPMEGSDKGSLVPETSTQGEAPISLPLAMDGTATTEFSIVDNTRYSQEIIAAARAAYDLEKLAELRRGSNLDDFLAESKRQILAQWHCDKALATHSDMYRVLFQINVGLILNEVEPTFKTKGEYMKWLRDNFGVKHLRYLQQARNLANMGDFAREYAAAGKNRLLAIDTLRKVEKKAECLALFDDHPLPDITDDEDGQILKNHIDTVITLHRLHGAGIPFATFNQAAIAASLLREAVTVQKADQLEKWLSSQAADERPALLDRYIQDQMVYPPERPYTPAPRASLNKILADLLYCYRSGDIENNAWIETQRALVDMDTLMSAQRLIGELIAKMGSEGPANEPTA